MRPLISVGRGIDGAATGRLKTLLVYEFELASRSGSCDLQGQGEGARKQKRGVLGDLHFQRMFRCKNR